MDSKDGLISDLRKLVAELEKQLKHTARIAELELTANLNNQPAPSLLTPKDKA